MRKRIGILILILMFNLAAIGCNGENTKDDNEISIYVGNSIFEESLDPIKGGISQGYPFINSALVRVDLEGKYKGDLATDWKISKDGLEYIFTLRKDVKFHDNSTFTAEDVVFTFNKVKENQGDNENVDLSKLKVVEEVDDFTVKFKLSEAYSPFLDSVALLGIVPSDSYDVDSFCKLPIGTGPWKILQHDSNQQIIVEKNMDYYDGEPEIDKVTFVNMDNEMAFSNAKSGQLDIVMVSSNYINEVIDGMKIENLDTMDIRNISLPTRKEAVEKSSEEEEFNVGNNVTSDIAVRKALSIGIDRKTVIKNALSGVGKETVSFTNNLPWGYVNEYKDNEKEEAKAILEKAGWLDTNGDGIRENGELICEFDIYTPVNDEERFFLATAVAEDVKTLGIKINVKGATWDEIEKYSLTEGVLWGWGQYNPTVIKSLFYSKLFMEGKYDNVVGYSNKEVDKAIENALNSNDEEVSSKEWKKAQEIASKDYPYLYIVNIEHSYFVNNKLDISRDTQIPHPHGHGLPVISNMKDWKLE